VEESGNYCFQPELVNKYHEMVLQDFIRSLNKGIPFIIVDNTNLKSYFRNKFVRKAESRGYPVYQKLIGELSEEAAQQYAQRNIHGVPLQIILTMLNKADLPLDTG
jgi:hypothetical protein